MQYGRRARSTTIYILWAQTLAQFYNSIYFMFLDGDMVIGGAMGMSAFFCLIVTTIYVYQPKAQKCVGRPSRTAIVRSSPQCVPQDGQDDVQS